MLDVFIRVRFLFLIILDNHIKEMNKLFPLKGTVQHYAWGGFKYISNFLGIEFNGEKYAEYWLGAHVNAPSVITTSNGYQLLDVY